MDTDPVTNAIVEHSLFSIVDEMGAVMVRTAYSPLVRDLYDFTVALFNPNGEMVAQGVGLALHLGALPNSVEAILNRYGDLLRPGDVVIINDSYETGMHMPNVVVLTPIFIKDKIVGYAVAMAHQTDIGGHVPGSVSINSREIFAEGLRIPPIFLERDGEKNETLFSIIEKNVRVPRDVFGDLQAQTTACQLGSSRFVGLCERYGEDVVSSVVNDLLDRSEKMARSEIAELPDGDFVFEDYLDNDGYDGPPQKLKVTLRIEGEEITADLSGTAVQAPTAINCMPAYSKSAFFLAVRSIMSPDIPNTGGFFRPLHLVAPEGTLVNPQFPAAVGSGLVSYRLADCIFGALAKAAPHLVRAASEGGTTRYTIATTNNTDSSILSESLVGAWGGHPQKDGVDGVANLAANMANSPIEMVESTYPVFVEEYGYQIDSEGAGKYRGGLGVRRKVRVLEETGAILQIRSGRAKFPPWGLNGGEEGTSCQNVLNPGMAEEKILHGNETMPIAGGTCYLHVTPGAGGFGPPHKRDPGLVARDVRHEKISLERAKDVYGVAILKDGTVDKYHTKKLRENS